MKNKKILKIIGIIVLILIIIFLIYFIRNLVILNKLERTCDYNNYSYELITHNNENYTVEYYYKDGISKEIWKNGETVINTIWYDNGTHEMINTDEKNLIALVNTQEYYGTNTIANTIISSILPDNVTGKMNKALTIFISTETVDGIAYYELQPWIGVTSNIYYFDKETGTLAKSIMGSQEMEFSNWKVNTVTDEDVARPDLTKYNLTEDE